MKLSWVTDIHLNFFSEPKAEVFCREIAETGAEAVLIGGDIAESHDLVSWLRFMEKRLARPIYFVLGNHDYYRSSIGEVRKNVRDLVRSSKWLHWLNLEETVRLSDSWGLVGVDGWGDARYGDHDGSFVQISDFLLIRDLFGLKKPELEKCLQKLGDKEGDQVRTVLPKALDKYKNILFLTHVPPFIEACWYEGKTSDENWAPYFTCKAVGQVLFDSMRARPDRKMTVLCGHTHSSGEVRMLPNLFVRTGKARYSYPEIQYPLIEIK